MNQKLEKQIKSELSFLGCQGMKHLVHMADLGACHEESITINNRKKKLKRLLKENKKKGGKTK